jgi:ketosteroid isomerase-like protein
MKGRTGGAVCAIAMAGFGCRAGVVAAQAPVAPPPLPPAPPLIEGATVARVSPSPPPERPKLAEMQARARDAWLAAFKGRDADRLASVYAEDACITSPGRPRVCGRAAIAEAARAAWAKVPEVRTAWGRTWRSGDVVAVESAWSADAKGTASLALCWFTPEGLIREQHVYADEGSISTLPPGTGGKSRPFDGLPTTRESHESNGASEERVDVELVRATFAAPALADDAELVDFAQPGSLVGKKHAARWAGARAGGLADPRAVVTGAWGVEGYVLCEYETQGTRRGTRGETATLHGAEVLLLEGGKVKRGWRYEDSLELAPAPGMPPMSPFAVP